MGRAPVVAVRRHEEAIKRFAYKISALAALLERGEAGRFPRRTSVAAFAKWQDQELNVQRISRSVVYSRADDCIRLRNQVVSLLERLARSRAKVTRKQSLESILRSRLADAEARNLTHANQFATLMVKFNEVQKEKERLEAEMARRNKGRPKLTLVRPPKGVGEPSDNLR